MSIYLELSQVHLRMKNVTAAQEVIAEAKAEFKKSKEEGRITIATAMVAAKRDVDQALGILRSGTRALLAVDVGGYRLSLRGTARHNPSRTTPNTPITGRC